MKLYVALDPSLRSTAVVVLDEGYGLIGQEIISSTNKQYNDEALLEYNSGKIYHSIERALVLSGADDLKAVAIERPSFGSKSLATDLISANHWVIRLMLWKEYPTAKLKITSVTEWRCKVISDVEGRLINDSAPVIRAKKGMKLTATETKENNKNKEIRKKATKELTVKKLPDDVKKSFDKYIKDAKLKDAAMYDLADAYFICKHLIDLEKKK